MSMTTQAALFVFFFGVAMASMWWSCFCALTSVWLVCMIAVLALAAPTGSAIGKLAAHEEIHK